MLRTLAAALLALGLAHPAPAQDWGDLDTLLIGTLTGGAPLLASNFFPDAATPEASHNALAIAYTEIVGAAGNVDIWVGLYARSGTGWVLTRRVDNLFGSSPSDPVFGPGYVEVTTDTLGPNDARCCPTQKTRWHIDLATGTVTGKS